VILVIKATTRHYREVPQNNCRLCGIHKSALPVSYYG
jgi:hypothetical protein